MSTSGSAYERLVRVLLAPFVEISAVLVDLRTALDIWNAPTIGLDRLGAKVGQSRDGRDDATRVMTALGRIAANRSRGRVSDLIRVARAFLAPDPSTGVLTATIEVDDESLVYEPTLMSSRQNAAVVVRVRNRIVTDAEATDLLRLLKIAVKGGVRLLLVTWAEVEEDTFSTALAAFAPQTNGIGATSIPAVPKRGNAGPQTLAAIGFPTSGELILDPGTASEEIVAYADSTGAGVATNVFVLTAPTTIAHVGTSGQPYTVVLKNAPGDGFDTVASPGFGGVMVSIRD